MDPVSGPIIELDLSCHTKRPWPTGTGLIMDADRKELVHHLFALATEIAEAAHETAVSGQASTMPPAKLIRAAAALRRQGDELAVIGHAIALAGGKEAKESPPEKSC